MSEQDTWITIGPAAQRLGVGRSAVHTLIKRGHLSVRTISGSWPRVPLSEVDAIAAQSTRAAAVDRGTVRA
jgi:excisionase family DNA binding protein